MSIPSKSKAVCPGNVAKTNHRPTFFPAGSLAPFFLTLLTVLATSVMPARATITVLDYWRMGEADTNAAAGGTPVNAADSVGTNTLIYSGPAVYSSDVAPAARTATGSALSVSFNGSAFASNNIITNAQNNFGLEAWIKPASTANNPILVYNGSTGSSGWGFMINNGTYQGLFGGVTYIGSGAVALNQWTHLAVVCSNGVATLYTNGVPAGASISRTPNAAVGNFEIGAQTVGGGSQYFDGLVDEVRAFTFTATQFSTNDLLLNLNPAISLGMTSLAVGPAGGTNSVVVADSSSAPWTVTANVTWLHPVNINGSTSTNLIFTCDTNLGATRSGILTVAGQALTVTQAGASYTTASIFTSLVSSGLYYPKGIAVGANGNVYIADAGNNAIKIWSAASNVVTMVGKNQVSGPGGVAVDAAGNIYIANTGANSIMKWTATNNTLTTLVPSSTFPPFMPSAIALDGSGNVYFADNSQNSSIRMWSVTNGTVTTLVSSGLSGPDGVAVDAAGNVYIADTGNNAIKEWNAASGTVSNLMITGLNYPFAVAVDAGGNVYIGDTYNQAIKKWSAINGTITTLSFPLQSYANPQGLAADGNGNVYATDSGNGVIWEQANAFVNPTAKVEGIAPGSDTLPTVLPAVENLLPPFAPASDAPWLTVTGATNGIVSYSFPTNNVDYVLGRQAHLTVLGRSIPVSQPSPPFAVLDTTNLLAGPGSGNGSVVLTVSPATAGWTNSSVAAWLHLSTAAQGSGSATILFSWDANSSNTPRSGDLMIANQPLVVTQAGADYAPATLAGTIYAGAQSTKVLAQGLAADAQGNVYIADNSDQAIKKWTATNNTVTTLYYNGVQFNPVGVAVDGAGNVYFSNPTLSAIDEWNASNSNVTTLVSSASNPAFQSHPAGLAMDKAGNLYVADNENNVVEVLPSGSSSVSTLISSSAGLSQPLDVAVDGAGDSVYIADSGLMAIERWTVLTSNLNTVPFANGINPSAVAVDGAGNVYGADMRNHAIDEWVAVDGSVPTISGFPYPTAVAVDATGNLFVADYSIGTVREYPHAFVCTASMNEPATAGNDALTAVLPATANLQGDFAPTSDSPWLTISNIANGVISFSFTANTTASSRTANVGVLGQNISVTQAAAPIGTPPNLTSAHIIGGNFQFTFTNNPSSSFTVWASTNLTLPNAGWTAIGTPTNTSSDVFQFSAPINTNGGPCFFRVTSP